MSSLSKSKPKYYDPEKLVEAIAAEKNGMKYKEASKMYDVPYTTFIQLHDKVNVKYKSY